MNPRQSTTAALVTDDVLEARFGLRVTSMLSEHTDKLPHDVTERLKFARTRALQQRMAARAVAPAAAGGAVRLGPALALFGGEEGPRWLRWVSVLPLLVLVAGLVLIQDEHSRELIEVAVDVDAQLLSGDLPPAAYRDAGFVEFLKAPSSN